MVDPDEVIDCGHGRHRDRGHRASTTTASSTSSRFRDVIAKSSDVGVIRVAQRLGRENFNRYMREFGFGVATGVELPGESTGLLRPDLALERALAGLALLRPGDRGDRAADGTAAVAAVANGGYLMKPLSRARASRTSDGPRGEGRCKPVAVRRVLEPRDGGRPHRPAEGRGARTAPGKHAAIPGYAVAGKTGTAQKIDATGRYSMIDHVASFVGFVPASRPALVILVSLDTPAGRAQPGRRRGRARSSRASPSTRCATWPCRRTTPTASCGPRPAGPLSRRRPRPIAPATPAAPRAADGRRPR